MEIKSNKNKCLHEFFFSSENYFTGSRDQWRNQNLLINGQTSLVPEKNGGRNGQSFY
jgi:hypothetical protein